MRKILIVVAAAFLITSCGQQTSEKVTDAGIVNNPATATSNETNGRMAVIEFEKDVHDFGEVIEGEVVSYSFIVHNTGDHDLVISNVSAGCGCTVPAYSKEPIRPGGKGKVDVEYNSSGRSGQFNTQVTVISNTNPNTHYLYVRGHVNKQ